MAARFYEALTEIGDGTIRLGNDFRYRRTHGMGRACDTMVYMLEHRGAVLLHRDGTLTLTSLGQAILVDHRNSITEENEEESIDADHS